MQFAHGGWQVGNFAVTDKTYLPSYKAGISDLVPEQKLWQAAADNDFVVAELDLLAK